MMSCPPSLDIAILLNSYRSPFINAIQRSYVKAIGAVSPGSNLTFFYPAEREGEFPDPTRFDLIIVGGGNVDPRKTHPWIVKVHGFIADVVQNFPHKKLCGICWGHQTISLVFGGEVADTKVPELGVSEVELTSSGQEFFSDLDGKIIRMQQHHRRHVSVRPMGFLSLIKGNQCFINDSGTILTFQGHPEKDAETAKLRIADLQRWFSISPQDECAVREITRSMELDHDGEAVWRRILIWAGEE